MRKKVQFSSVLPNVVQFNSQIQNWTLNWTVRLQSQTAPWKLSWGSGLLGGGPEIKKIKKIRKSKTMKKVQFSSVLPNVVQFRFQIQNWTLNWTVRLQSQTAPWKLGWGSGLLGGGPEIKKNQKNQKIKNHEKGTI